MSTATSQRVIYIYPTVVNLTDSDAATPRSWIQLARTGSFVSKRYGKFSITREDLAQMLRNTPKPPTELVVDYDHLSTDPKRPGDSAAAGWMKKLELRDGGDTLWAEVEWTEDGAERIRKKEYRFVSPSFVKGFRDKNTGADIGTTLIAAAITNSPFLEGMASLTLSTPAVQSMNLTAPLRDLVAAEDGPVALSTTTIGQHVTIDPQQARSPQHVGATFEIVKIDGMAGDEDAHVWLRNVQTHQDIGWYLARELQPARANAPSPIPSDRPQQEDRMDANNNADAELITLANTIAQEQGISLRAATIEAGRRRPDLADARREAIGFEETNDTEAQARPVVNLRAGETFLMLCQRTAAERQIHLTQAIRLVSQAHPTLAEAYSRGEM